MAEPRTFDADDPCVVCGVWYRFHAPYAETPAIEHHEHLSDLRSEAQDTAASSGLREFIDAADHMKIVGGHPVEMGRNDRREWYDAVVAYDKTRIALAQPTPEPALTDESIREAMRRGDMSLPSINRASKRLLGDDFRTPEPSLRDEQEANSAAWHESIRRAQAAKEADTPEPSLRNALAAALLETNWWTHGGITGYEWTNGELADAIIAALPGLSLSAQPSEPGETVP